MGPWCAFEEYSSGSDVGRSVYLRNTVLCCHFKSKNDQCLVTNSQVFCTLGNFYLPLSQFYNVVHKMISTVSPNSLSITFIKCRSVNWDLTQGNHIIAIFQIALKSIQIINNIFIWIKKLLPFYLKISDWIQWKQGSSWWYNFEHNNNF